jgi:hypothetical protein
VPLLLFDTGNYSDHPTPEGEKKTALLLAGMERLGYSVVNVGEREIRLGYPEFMKQSGRTSLRFVSANVVRQEGQEPVFAPHLVLPIAAAGGKKPLKVGVTGVLRYNPLFVKPGPEEGSNIVVLHPVEPVRKAVAALRAEGVDLVVLLAALHKDDVRRIVEEVPGIDFVLGCYGGLVTADNEKMGETRVLYTGNKGQRLSETRVFLGAGEGPRIERELTRIHLLTANYPDSPAMAEFLRSAGSAAPAAAEEVDESGRADDGASGAFVGSAGCKPCHAAEYEQWGGTPHANAFATLQKGGKSEEPLCTSCHSTGAARPGGFASLEATPHLAAVGCESCHGAGREHLARPTEPFGRVELASCTGCHDRANSPRFDYYAYLPRITHRARAGR